MGILLSYVPRSIESDPFDFVFEKTADGFEELERIDLPKEMAMHGYAGEDHPLFSLDLLITAGCGGGFINRMASHNVQVIPTSETDPKTAVVGNLGQPSTYRQK